MAGATLLGITQSLTERKWCAPTDDALKEAERLTAFAGLNPVVAKTFARLGAKLETLDQFVDPKLRDLLPDPSNLLDMDQATTRIMRAIENRERIAIFADYDVDGASSAALLIEYFRHFDITPTLYIPDRILEGYGPNTPAMTALAEDHDLIITVDCGTLAFEPISAARAQNSDVIILDHHMASETLPDALTVNPNRQDCDNSLGHLCAAGVVFLVLVSLNRQRSDQEPNLMSMLDLVALATVADVAPLIGVNRAFVRSGLQVMSARKRPGLKALIDQHLKFQTITSEHIGFTLAPRLNAGGRIGRAHAATELLTAQSENEAAKIIVELETQNTARREIEAGYTEEAIAQIEANPTTQNFVYAAGKDWHPGVLGIVAARLKSHFGKPALALGITNQTASGSARSIKGVDLGGAIAMLVSEELISKGGGHKMAAGLSLDETEIDAAMSRLDQLLARQSKNLQPALEIDAITAPRAITINLLNELERAGPFGASAPSPFYAITDARLEARTILKERHIKYRFNAQGHSFDVMAFGAVGGRLDLGSEISTDQRFHIAISAKINHWQGRTSVQLLLEDIATGS